MELWMTDQLSMFDLMNCESSPSATSSRASGSGLTPCDPQDGPMTVLFGQEAARASLSARQVQEAGLMTSGTYGRTGTISSASAALQSSLASRLQARTASAGSTLYTLTWKQRATPSGLLICALRASARRISDNASGLLGWQTPVVQDSKQSGLAPSGTGNSLKLSFEVQQAGWPTPTTRDHKDTGNLEGSMFRRDGQMRDDTVPRVAWIAGWPTPTVQSPNSQRGRGQDPEKRKAGGHSVNLNDAVRYLDHNGPARLTVSGEMLIGSSAEMESGGQLNPAHSRWLMGLPPEWDDCAVTAMPSLPRSRKPSSKA
jgi:hypothetical protein